jgi:hypothetical protein
MRKESSPSPAGSLVAAIGICVACLMVPGIHAVDIPRVYYLGDCAPTTSPINIVKDDPALDVIAVPAVVGAVWWTVEEVSRALRLYMPRSYEEMIARTTQILLSDVKARHLPSQHIEWFARAVRDQGMSLMMFGGISSFGGHPGVPSIWEDTSVAAILPVELIPEANGPGPWKPKVTLPEDPLMEAFPWDECPHFYGYNKVISKEGASLLAETNRLGDPFMVSWSVGSGRSFAFCTDWTPDWGKDFQKWEYYIDFCVYSIYYTMGREIPIDLGRVHLIRSKMLENRVRKDILISLLGFVEKFGGSVLPAERGLKDVDAVRARANEAYLVQDYVACLSHLQAETEGLLELEEEAARSRERALAWIWAIEWLTVTATLMITGFVLWSLMVRRTLFREIGLTVQR